MSWLNMQDCRHWRQAGLLLCCSLMVSACGLFGRGEKQPEYYAAVETADLQIPEGLDRPGSTTALVIMAPPSPLPERELQSLPPRVSSQSTSNNDNTSLRWGADGVHLLVDDTAESVQRRLGFVIKRAGLNYREASAEGGFLVDYYHREEASDEGFFSRLAFWRDDGPNYSGEYLILPRPDGEMTRVYLRNADGSDPDPAAAEHLLVILGERLG